MYYGLEVLSITFSVVVGNFTNKIKLLVMEGGCLEVWKSSVVEEGNMGDFALVAGP